MATESKENTLSGEYVGSRITTFVNDMEVCRMWAHRFVESKKF